MHKIILASQSPRRMQLLKWAEVPFKIIASDVDESFPEGFPTDEVPVFIAKKKALSVQQKINDDTQIILAADTLVVLNNKIICTKVTKVTEGTK